MIELINQQAKDMQANNSSIVIVDDTKFSSAIVRKILTLDGFTDIRVANSALDALSMMKDRHADILIADWLMPGIDGLELTQLLRELNRRKNTFTYVVLLTAKEESQDLKLAFASGVDDFVGKTTIKSHLLPRIHAAQRISKFQNSLLQREQSLQHKYQSLSLLNRIDAETGIGNLQFFEQQLTRYLKQHRGRNGFVGVLLCRFDNLAEQAAMHGIGYRTALLKQAAKRLAETARPMDDVAIVNDDTLALALYGNESSFVTHALIRRVQEAVLDKPYQLDDRYSHLLGTVQYDVIDTETTTPNTAAEVIAATFDRLNQLPSGQSLHFWELDSEPA